MPPHRMRTWLSYYAPPDWIAATESCEQPDFLTVPIDPQFLEVLGSRLETGEE